VLVVNLKSKQLRNRVVICIVHYSWGVASKTIAEVQVYDIIRAEVPRPLERHRTLVSQPTKIVRYYIR